MISASLVLEDARKKKHDFLGYFSWFVLGVLGKNRIFLLGACCWVSGSMSMVKKWLLEKVCMCREVPVCGVCCFVSFLQLVFVWMLHFVPVDLVFLAFSLNWT